MARNVRSISAMDTSGWTTFVICGDSARLLAMIVQSRPYRGAHAESDMSVGRGKIRA
jgi:hypothetical protein